MTNTIWQENTVAMAGTLYKLLQINRRWQSGFSFFQAIVANIRTSALPTATAAATASASTSRRQRHRGNSVSANRDSSELDVLKVIHFLT